MTKEAAIAHLRDMRDREFSDPDELYHATGKALDLIVEANPSVLFHLLFDHIYNSGYGINKENINSLIENMDR